MTAQSRRGGCACGVLERNAPLSFNPIPRTPLEPSPASSHRFALGWCSRFDRVCMYPLWHPIMMVPVGGVCATLLGSGLLVLKGASMLEPEDWRGLLLGAMWPFRALLSTHRQGRAKHWATAAPITSMQPTMHACSTGDTGTARGGSAQPQHCMPSATTGNTSWACCLPQPRNRSATTPIHHHTHSSSRPTPLSPTRVPHGLLLTAPCSSHCRCCSTWTRSASVTSGLPPDRWVGRRERGLAGERREGGQ